MYAILLSLVLSTQKRFFIALFQTTGGFSFKTSN